MTTVPCFHVDAFTKTPFHGNPAAVCLLTKPRSAAWMTAIAAEMNLSETAFVAPFQGGFRLRWFTPRVEVALCGHATLAAAHVLWQEGLAPADAVLRFFTKSGVLTAARRDSRIELDFPVRRSKVVAAPKGLAAALGIAPRVVARNVDDLLVEAGSEREVRALRPDFAALAKLPVRGIAVTARSRDRRWDFVSRFFAPAVGIDEDPVTGSSHCALAAWWGERFGRDVLTGFQCSPRGGEVEVQLAGERVLLRGQAVTVVRGELILRVR